MSPIGVGSLDGSARQLPLPALRHLPLPARPIALLQPPRLLQRADRSAAQRLGSSDIQRRALHAVSDKHLGDLNNPGWAEHRRQNSHGAMASIDSFDDRGAARVPKRGERIELSSTQKAERSYQRMLVALKAGAGAVMPSRAELVLGFCGSVR